MIVRTQNKVHILFIILYRVFSVIVFSAMNIGQTSSFAPDYAKAKMSAQRIFMLLVDKPTIDIYSEDGEKPVSTRNLKIDCILK